MRRKPICLIAELVPILAVLCVSGGGPPGTPIIGFANMSGIQFGYYLRYGMTIDFY